MRTAATGIALVTALALAAATSDGTVSMARAEADTATSDFFVCIGREARLKSHCK